MGHGKAGGRASLRFQQAPGVRLLSCKDVVSPCASRGFAGRFWILLPDG